MTAVDDITVVVVQQPAVHMQAAGTEAMNTQHRRFERTELPIAQLRMREARDRARPMQQHPMPALRTLAHLMPQQHMAAVVARLMAVDMRAAANTSSLGC